MSRPAPNPSPGTASAVAKPQVMDYVTLFQQSLKEAFLRRVKESNRVSDKAKKFFSRIEEAKKSFPSTAECVHALKEIHLELSQDKAALNEVLKLDGKQQDILRRARKAATDGIVDQYKELHFDQSHSLASELRKCQQAGMSKEQVQEHVTKYFRAAFSLTGHPTNTHSLEYTTIGYELDSLLSSRRHATESELMAVLDRVIASPDVGVKKTPKQEMEETNLALETILKNKGEIKARLEEVIAQSSAYSDYNDIKLSDDFLEVSVWTHGGDADGNPNIVASVLQEGYESVKDFERRGLKVTIDIRHDAGDLMKAMDGVLKKIGITNFSGMSAEDQEKMLAELLENPEALAAMQKELPDDPAEAEIVKRLRICGENPGCTEKLIIANTTGANNALAALLLLKITGNKVAEPGAAIDIVTLSESIEDLKGIHKVQQSLLANETYRKHLRYRGRIQQMIAKSDTFRVGGPGAEFWQDVAAGEAYLLRVIEKRKYGLDNLDVRVFNGGGAALQRGGGKPDEAANRQAKALLYVLEKYNDAHPHPDEKITIGEMVKGVTSLTIQGHQQQLFCSESVIMNSLEALAAQNLHSAFLAEGLMQSKEDVRSEDIRGDFCNAAIEAYQNKYFYDPKAPKEGSKGRYINELFSMANLAGVAAANLSSRPAKRPVKKGDKAVAIASGITYDQLIGDRGLFDVFGTRAITLDRTLAHSGTFAVMFLGLNEAFATKTSEELREVYAGSKGFRDFVRNQITVLFMVDFDHAWEMMAGRQRPSPEEIEAMAKKFETIETVADIKERQAITLAYLDVATHNVGKRFYEIIEGKPAPKDLELKTLLDLYSPELAIEMRFREREALLGKISERDFVARGNADGSMVLDQYDLDRIILDQRASDIASNAPVLMSAILSSMTQEIKTGRTSESPVDDSRSTTQETEKQGKVKSLFMPQVLERLQVPSCLANIARAIQHEARAHTL